MNINENILNILNKKKIKQKDLGLAIGVSPSTLNNWLKLGRSIPAEFIIPICEFLKINVNWLLTGEENMDVLVTDDRQNNKNELAVDEELLLETYKELDKETKKETLKFITSKTQNNSKNKLSTYNNTDEISTTLDKAVS